MTDKLQRLDCGCTYRAERWVQLCKKHEAEWREVHERSAADRKRMQELDDLLA